VEEIRRREESESERREGRRERLGTK